MSVKGLARHRGQPGLVDGDYEKHCASNLPDGRSNEYHEYAQVDVTVLSVMYSIEPPSTSISAHSALEPLSNVVVRVENNETLVDNRREATLLQLQIAQHMETQEITHTDMLVHESGAGEIQLGMSMADSAPSLSGTCSLNASQPTGPKRPKNRKRSVECLGPEILVRGRSDPQ
jgi:hypothetical protein